MGNNNSANKDKGLKNAVPEKKPLPSIPLAFFDLPDDLLLKIFESAKIGPVGFKMRLDKRTELRIRSLLKSIRLEIHLTHYCLTLNTKKITFNKSDLVEVFYVSQALSRWSDTMKVRAIEIIAYAQYEESIAATLFSLCQFNANKLAIKNEASLIQFPAFFPELDFTTLLVMAANMRKVSIDFPCTSIQGMDLCILWKTLLKDDCKLQSFSIIVKYEVNMEFLKSAFKVTMDDVETRHTTVTYRTSISLHPVKLYSRSAEPQMYRKWPLKVISFSDNLKMEIDDHRISFEKINCEDKAKIMSELFEIEMHQTDER